MKRFFTLISLTISLCFTSTTAHCDETLRHKAAKMLMVGFKGDSITNDNPVLDYLMDIKVGGIILFDVDLTGDRTLGSRNITSREQLKKLTSDLKETAGYPLLIACDQEGGLVQRLKPVYGFSKLPSAKYIGTINNPDTTTKVGYLMAKELSMSGINVNLAPELDLHNDSCPVIGNLDRAFSSCPDSVTFHAELIIDQLHNNGIIACVKHFPGHGSAVSDSHYGLTDVTSTWNENELLPFKQLIDKGKVDMVMTAHIFNRNIDDEYPATLSHKILTGLLREKLGFNGVILTDDMYMQGIIDNYEISNALITAINAGADMFIIGNNITTGFEPDRPAKLVDIIVDAVEKGLIPIERIDEANNHINSLLEKL